MAESKRKVRTLDEIFKRMREISKADNIRVQLLTLKKTLQLLIVTKNPPEINAPELSSSQNIDHEHLYPYTAKLSDFNDAVRRKLLSV